MSTALQTPQVANWDDQELVKAIKDTVCRGATDSQFRMFVEVCKATGLNPWLREIWFVPNVGVMAGRDGYLRIANDHPMFDGMSTTVERDAEGIPIKATCSVWRKDRAHPITCEAFYNEYRKNSQVWQTYKSAMISKVAEVLALKRSFSINGIATEEEIGEQKAQAISDQQDVAQKRIKELSAPKAERVWDHTEKQVVEIQGTTATVITELADFLDTPPHMPTDVSQADKAVLSTARSSNPEGGRKPEKPAQRKKKGTIPFQDLGIFGNAKAAFRDLDGDTHEYYDMLKLKGVSHADELKAEDVAPMRALMAERYKQKKKEKEERELLMEAQKHALRIGPRFTKEILDRKGLECIDDILNLSGTPLDDLLRELRSTA